jgi:hypothetical protein
MGHNRDEGTARGDGPSFRKFFPNTVVPIAPVTPVRQPPKAEGWPSIPGYEVLSELGRGGTVREDAVRYSIAEHLEKEFFSLDGDGLAWKAERKELAPSDLPEAFAAVKAL